MLDSDDAGRAVARSHWLRTLGLGLGTLMVGAVLYRRGTPASLWVLLVLNGLAWPQVAWLILRRCDLPVAVDRRFFMGDVAMGGVWLAVMQFAVLPSVVLATMFAIAAIAIDGTHLLLRALMVLAVVCGVAAAANGFVFVPATDMRELLASLPLLVGFPVALGCITHHLAMRVRNQNEQLLKISSTDNLSGLMNRNHWEVAANAALARHCCEGAVMLMMDIDSFKSVNDQYGHTAGDAVIQRAGEVIRSGLREGDLAGRYGGDEFAVVLCGIDAGIAAAVAERIRSSVACSLFERSPGLRCTLSIGLAASPANRNVSDWIKAADAALYRAKLAGRNRLVVAG
ncbi:MAG TPA: diguanylate cyclase [Rhodanobacteraceae bacterium]|nr:diguanylate cyclase [Rhodanobacteraceae bacterium]